jgi:hypothetical protein
MVVLLHKNKVGYEQPISFFGRELIDVELRYNILEKRAYALEKELKAFHDYILH